MSDAAIAAVPVEEAARLRRRVTRLSVAAALVLTAIKAVAWHASGSVSMLASLADSGLDVIAALGTYFAVRYAANPPDAEHRYGHGKAEAFASLVQAGLVFASAALVGQQAVADLMHPHALSYEAWGLAVMAVSIVLTCGLVYAQSQVLKKAQSVAIQGDRLHYAADLASNLMAFIGIGVAALIRAPQPDAIAGLLVVAWLVWGAVSVFRRAAFELMDHELDEASRTRIVALMKEDRRVKDVHQLRTRASGPYIHIQMHVDLDPALSLVEAHQVMVEAEKRVLDALPAADIIIHPDPRGKAEAHGGAFAEVHEGAPVSR